MTYEELKAEAKRQGYRLVKDCREKLLPCSCGCKKRDTWYCGLYGEDKYIKLVCQNCGFTVKGKTVAEARRNWNECFRTQLNKKGNKWEDKE